MIETLFWVLVGAFVAWNLPQPSWAKSVQEKYLQKYMNMIWFLRK